MTDRPPPPPPGKPSRTPIFLSAFVYPGVGQLVQKRWLAAAVFGFSFSVMLVVFAISAFHIIAAFYRLAFDPDSVDPARLPKIEMLVSGLISLTLYVLNVFDTFLAHRRIGLQAARVRRDQRLRERIHGASSTPPAPPPPES